MTDLRELYQQVILDHNKSPHNFRAIEGADRVSVGHNPVCGDRLSLFVKLEGDRIADIGFQGSGCATSKASASPLTDNVKGKSGAEARGPFGQ
ncbi:MAG TPA: SUF system NifU family Fe-S cluster assembly protein, partial [Thermoanaerobaculia bacterium]|nr:SUF system NifU family Fe-S cluster assembly protein [Thermoanaerobaculia bacterium]